MRVLDNIDKEELPYISVFSVVYMRKKKKRVLLLSSVMRAIRTNPALENWLIFLFEKQSK